MSSEFRHQASLVLNVVLAVTVGVLALNKFNGASAPSSAEVNPGKANNAPVISQQSKSPEPQPELARYGDIASASDRRRAVIDQLRTMGVPNEVLALVANVDREVQWDGRFEGNFGNKDKMEALQLEKDMSKDAEMRAALGDEDFKKWDTKNMLWEAMSTEVETTASEAEAIYTSKKKLEQRLLDAQRAKLDGTMDEHEADAASDKAYSEYNQELKAVMGDERYAKSQQLDEAFATERLRDVLNKGKVTPSDSQFQELRKIEKQFDDAQVKLDKQFETDPSLDVGTQNRALNKARDQEYERVLGKDAFDALQKSKDLNYAQMKKYETYWGLDDHKIDYVYNALNQYRNAVLDQLELARALKAQGQSTDAINNYLQQLTDETQKTFQNHLGKDTLNKLQRNGVVQFYDPQSQH